MRLTTSRKSSRKHSNNGIALQEIKILPKEENRSAGNAPFLRKKIRAIGIDDGYFKPRTNGKTKIVAVLLRSDARIEGILCSDVTIDGLDSTEQIVKMLKDNHAKFLGQAEAVFLGGINFAGFNIADAGVLHEELKKPIIIVFRKRPSMKKIFRALARFSDAAMRIKLLKKAGRIYKAEKIHFQCIGIEPAVARVLISKFSIHSNLPEPVRIAHIVASAVTLGRSTAP